jgi:hypothetical protein
MDKITQQIEKNDKASLFLINDLLIETKIMTEREQQ